MAIGQELRVGRTEWADFSVPDDGRMSGVHFALQADRGACYLQDLGSSNGTAVNRETVADRTQLADGDEILAGETRFQVHLEPEEGEAAVSPVPPRPRPAHVESTPAPGSRQSRQGKGHYSVEPCDSGLSLYRGNVEEIHPADLAALLGKSLPLYLIVDFRKIDPPLPLPESPCYLFDWLAPEAAPLVSPVVITGQEHADWTELLRQGWGNDAVVGLFSKRARNELVEHLRRSVHAKGKRSDQSPGMIGFCWPSVMALLLSHHSPRFVNELLTGIDAVLVELPDLPETWQLFGDATLDGMLDSVGLVRTS